MCFHSSPCKLSCLFNYCGAGDYYHFMAIAVSNFNQTMISYFYFIFFWIYILYSTNFCLIKKTRITCTFHNTNDLSICLLYSIYPNIDFIKIWAIAGLIFRHKNVFQFFQESYTYKDPITEFVECLYVNFDFDSAQKKLRECESVSNHFINLTKIHLNLLFPSFEKQLVLIVPLRDNTEVLWGPLICRSDSWTFTSCIVVDIVWPSACSHSVYFCWPSEWGQCRQHSDSLCLVSYCQI